jgi:DNA-binding response OmpR family regulator
MTSQLVSRILVIEDEPFIAADIEHTLTDAGFVIAGSAAKFTDALELAKSLDFDAAILDANLAGISAGPVATELGRRGIPYIVLSGYSLEQQPEEMRNSHLLTKPFNPVQLVSTLRRVLAR